MRNPTSIGFVQLRYGSRDMNETEILGSIHQEGLRANLPHVGGGTSESASSARDQRLLAICACFKVSAEQGNLRSRAHSQMPVRIPRIALTEGTASLWGKERFAGRKHAIKGHVSTHVRDQLLLRRTPEQRQRCAMSERGGGSSEFTIKYSVTGSCQEF